MSSRKLLADRVANVIADGMDDKLHAGDIADAVLDAFLPEIRDAKQLEKGVPEGSILIVPTQTGARAVTWSDGHLHGWLRADGMPMTPHWVIERYGPMTVVWMP